MSTQKKRPPFLMDIHGATVRINPRTSPTGYLVLQVMIPPTYNIKLSWLIFKEPKERAQDHSLKSAVWTKKKYQADALAAKLELKHIKGDVVDNRRIASPSGKRRNS